MRTECMASSTDLDCKAQPTLAPAQKTAAVTRSAISNGRSLTGAAVSAGASQKAKSKAW